MDIEEAQQLAERHGFMFVETSAYAAENVDTAFERLLNSISEVRQRMYSNGRSNQEQSR